MEPITMLIIAASTLAGGVGVKKGIDAHSKTRKAIEKNKNAQQLYTHAKEALKQAKEQTELTLKNLGELKLKTWAGQLGRFIAAFERLKCIEVKGDVEIGELRGITETIAEMKNISYNAKEALSGGVAALSAGALVGVASYGGAMMFASASSGPAIASLYGIAASNATLAWFGGGSLASGGLGMSGGIAVLGGIVAGPVLAIGGIVMDAQARKKLALAQENLSIAKVAKSEMDNAKSICNGITRVAELFSNAIMGVSERFEHPLSEFENLLSSYENNNWMRRFLNKIHRAIFKKDRGIPFKRLEISERKHIHLTVSMVQVLKGLLETPLLSKEGALRDDYKGALIAGNKLLEAGE